MMNNKEAWGSNLNLVKNNLNNMGGIFINRGLENKELYNQLLSEGFEMDIIVEEGSTKLSINSYAIPRQIK